MSTEQPTNEVVEEQSVADSTPEGVEEVQVEDTSTIEEAPSEEVPFSVSPEQFEEYRQQVENVQQTNTQLVAELKTAVGRAQSLQSRLDDGQGDTESLRKDLAKESTALDRVLDTVLDGLDETVLDDSAAKNLRSFRQERQDSKTRAELEREIMEKVRSEIGSNEATPAPSEPNVAATALNTLEAEIVAEIKDFGLDPDDAALFDWEVAADMLRKAPDNSTQVKAYFRKQVREGLQERDANDRRQARKETAPVTPDSAGASDENPLRTGNPEQDLKNLLRMTGKA